MVICYTEEKRDEHDDEDEEKLKPREIEAGIAHLDIKFIENAESSKMT